MKNVNKNNIQMLYYDRIDVSDSIDINTTSTLASALFVGIDVVQIKDLKKGSAN